MAQIKLDAFISKDAPSARNSLWIKPCEGGFEIYAKYNGNWQPLKQAEPEKKIPTDVVTSSKLKSSLKTLEKKMQEYVNNVISSLD